MPSPVYLGKPRGIGYEGEALVTSLLPNAIHINEEKEARKLWDVEWDGLLIDVKTTKANKTCPRFNHAAEVLPNVIFVYVDLSDADDIYFWIQHGSQGFKYIQSIKHGLRDKELAQAILDCNKTYA